MTKMNIVLFIAGFLRCVSGKYQALFYFLYTVSVLFIKIEGGRNTMRFVQVI